MKKRWSLMLSVCLIFLMLPGMGLTVSAEDATDQLLSTVEPEIRPFLYGQETDGNLPQKDGPEITLPYTRVYEPDTSWPLAATIAWRADNRALDISDASERPATGFIWLDSSLKVYDKDGALLSDSLDDYVNNTAEGMIPAFYIRDAETASALKSWLSVSGLLDCFVVSTPENKELVKDVSDLLHIRGMLDYTSVKNPERSELLDMIASVNRAHGKVILLSAEAATRKNVRFLQSLASTVWAQSSSDLKTLMTLYTNGVNGVVTDDYLAAIHAEELFKDDKPSLLRIPLIIGHRGDPSTYVENTLDSAIGAYQEGVDSVENDIQLSRDGQLYILHDDSPYRLMGIPEVEKTEDLTLSDLRSHPFNWDNPAYGIIENNEVPASRSRYGTLYGQESQKPYYVPTLQEYIEAFKDTGLVHDTEIKSDNPAIIPVYKELVDQYDAWDQFFTITFNKAILNAVYRDYPEISIGALGLGGWTDVKYDNFDAITEKEGAESALKSLYGTIDQWNATYNPVYIGYGEEMVRAGRHRGLTVWPWTYTLSDPGGIARDYLNAVTGITIDYPWIASDLIIEISSDDITVSSVEDIPKPQGKTQSGDQKLLESAELVELDEPDRSGNQHLMIWRYKADMNINGRSYGSYYLYSNPFDVNMNDIPVCLRDDTCPMTPFMDTDKNKWYHDGVHWALQNEIMSGTSDNTLEPITATTRAMLVTMLWRMEGRPQVDGTFTFKDVPDGKWYTEAIRWAVSKGIVAGYDKNTFGTDDPATREQLATILYRSAQAKGHGFSGGWAFPLNYDDADQVSVWADEAMHWMVMTGMIQGVGDKELSPKSDTSRAQAATILMRFSDKKVKESSNCGRINV